MGQHYGDARSVCVTSLSRFACKLMRMKRHPVIIFILFDIKTDMSLP